MSYQPEVLGDIPEQTRLIAQAAFPKGNVYMAMRDELGILFGDVEFQKLFARVGQPGISAWRLTMVTILQFMEGLADRQAADGVRGRIEWKYLLGLDITDPGFDASVLSEFRDRLAEANMADYLLNKLLDHFKSMGLLKNWNQQRTDATHILGNLRRLSQLELLGETLRAGLNALAIADPTWLRSFTPSEWYERYGARVEGWHLPRSNAAREALGLQIASDGAQLLWEIYQNEATPQYLHQISAVKILRQVWVQQVEYGQDKLSLRDPKDRPPSHRRIESPYELEARYATKRDVEWSGYKVHLTETCAQDDIHLITHVETTPAPVLDHKTLPAIHEALERKNLVPEQHLVDEGYVDGRLLLESREQYHIDLISPMRSDRSWQAKNNEGFDLTRFQIDWEHQQVECPTGQISQRWKPYTSHSGEIVIAATFSQKVCRGCPVKALCTRRKYRTLTFRTQPLHEVIQAARTRENTDDFKKTYARRAGVESTFSQGTRAFELRRSRYRGLAKTHVQHVFTAIAINLARAVAWLAQPTCSPPYVSPFAALAPT